MPGCGLTPFNRQFEGFRPDATLLARPAMLYRRGEGILRSALDLPTVEERDSAAGTTG